MKDLIVIGLVSLFAGLLVYGECRCIYKIFKCNWEPIGKAEVIYTGSALTGLGCITGYFNIVDK